MNASPSGVIAVERGAGPTVVLVHGALGDYRQWEPIANRLQEQYRVVAVSRRHHWPNPAPPPDVTYSYDSHRDDLVRYLRGGVDPVHLVGHSWGAGLALLVAFREPRLVRSLTLIEPPFGSLLPASAPGLDEEIASRRGMLEAVQSMARRGDADQAARALVDWLQASPEGFASLPPETQRALLNNAATVGPTFSTPPPDVSAEALRTLQVPALVLAGERTRPYFRLIARSAAEAIPGARLGVILGAGHMSILERPTEAAAAIGSFLGNVTG